MSQEVEKVKSENKIDQSKNCLKNSIDRFEKSHARSLIAEVVFFLIVFIFLLLFIFSL